MSDVEGIYNKPPDHDGARIMHTFVPSDLPSIKFGEASNVGTGGMESKVKSALWALDRGTSVVICNGMEYNTIRKIFAGQRTGSFFTNAEDESIPVEVMAQNCKYCITVSNSMVCYRLYDSQFFRKYLSIKF